VRWIVERMRTAWGDAPTPQADSGPRPHEAGLLRLDSSRARAELGWRPVLDLGEAIGWIVEWHKAVAGGEDARAVSLRQIARYAALAGSARTAGLAA
jgi:CDP-glucose 4,6-dehydratase